MYLNVSGLTNICYMNKVNIKVDIKDPINILVKKGTGDK